jgi:hypothetical protein
MSRRVRHLNLRLEYESRHFFSKFPRRGRRGVGRERGGNYSDFNVTLEPPFPHSFVCRKLSEGLETLSHGGLLSPYKDENHLYSQSCRVGMGQAVGQAAG